MSHIVTITTQVRDPAAVNLACQRLQLPAPQPGTTKLFTEEVAGLCVQLPAWRYPVVCDTDSGQLHYDNFNGHWGETAHLHRFLQFYSVEKTKLEARKVGRTATEQVLADGSIRLQIAVAG